MPTSYFFAKSENQNENRHPLGPLFTILCSFIGFHHSPILAVKSLPNQTKMALNSKLLAAEQLGKTFKKEADMKIEYDEELDATEAPE